MWLIKMKILVFIFISHIFANFQKTDFTDMVGNELSPYRSVARTSDLETVAVPASRMMKDKFSFG